MPPFAQPQPPIANAGGDPRMNNPLMALLTRGVPGLSQQQPGPPQQLAQIGGGQSPSPTAMDMPNPQASAMPQGPPGMQGPQGPPQGPQGMQGANPGNLVEALARGGATSPQPPINPVVDMYDNTPPIVREAIRRRLFTEGM
jgi:hypothetical protein